MAVLQLLRGMVSSMDKVLGPMQPLVVLHIWKPILVVEWAFTRYFVGTLTENSFARVHMKFRVDFGFHTKFRVKSGEVGD